MKHFKFVSAVLINLLIMTLFLIFTQMNYEIADNQTYSLFIADGDYHIIYTNYFLCLFCGLIQKIIFPLNAFVLVHLLFCFCAFVTITRVFLDKFNFIIAMGITLFINGFFAVNHYETVSFTRAPALLCAAGFLCIIHYVNKKKWKTGVVIGSILLLIGSTYRFQIFEVAVAVAVCFVIAKSISEYFAIDKNSKKIKNMFSIIFSAKRLFICIIVVLICFFVNFISETINTSTDELSYYKEYNYARSAVWDYAIPDYDECKLEYDNISARGIDENDISMLRAGYMDDEGAFSLDVLQKIKDVQTQYNNQTKSVIPIIKNMIISELGNIRAIGDKGIACLAFGLVLIAFLVICRKRMYIIPILLICVIFLFYSYLWITGKCPFRAVYVLWISAVLYMFYSFSYNDSYRWLQKIYESKKKLCLLLVSALFIISSLGGLYLSRTANDSLDRYPSEITGSNLQNYIEKNTDKKFEIARSVSLSLVENDNVFSVNDKVIVKYCEVFNCTYYNYPNYKQEVRNFGTDNMYRNLLKNNVYFIDNENNSHCDMMKNYLQKYYSDNQVVYFEIVDNIDNYQIVKFSLR